MMQDGKECVAGIYNLLLAGLWLRLEGCQLVGLPAMSIKQLGPRENRTSRFEPVVNYISPAQPKGSCI